MRKLEQFKNQGAPAVVESLPTSRHRYGGYKEEQDEEEEEAK